MTTPDAPGGRRRLGILGGGQLARMLALAARPLDVDCVVVEPGGAQCPAAPVAPVLVAPFDDAEAIVRWVEGCDAVTVELEAVPVDVLAWLAERVPVRPSPELVAVSQDRLAEKRLFRSLGIATAPFDDEVRPEAAAIVKTRRGGYDGRGQVRTRDAASRAAALAELPEPIVEGVVTFRRELSVIAARASDGTVVTYPLVANHHGGGILRRSLAPAPDVGPQMQDEAVSIARRVLERFGSVGVVAVELFDVGGRLVANEFAPRVHNSGHWTIEGAETSQFEQHVRAVLGLPLGSCAARGLSAMVNLIGTEPDAAAVLAVPGAHLHRYGKAPRPGRKLGHVTVTAESPEQLVDRLTKLDAALAG